MGEGEREEEGKRGRGGRNWESGEISRKVEGIYKEWIYRN